MFHVQSSIELLYAISHFLIFHFSTQVNVKNREIEHCTLFSHTTLTARFCDCLREETVSEHASLQCYSVIPCLKDMDLPVTAFAARRLDVFYRRSVVLKFLSALIFDLRQISDKWSGIANWDHSARCAKAATRSRWFPLRRSERRNCRESEIKRKREREEAQKEEEERKKEHPHQQYGICLQLRLSNGFAALWRRFSG